MSLGDQPLLEAAVLTAVAVTTGIGRFALLRHWVFRPGPAEVTQPAVEVPAAQRSNPG